MTHFFNNTENSGIFYQTFEILYMQLLYIFLKKLFIQNKNR